MAFTEISEQGAAGEAPPGSGVIGAGRGTALWVGFVGVALVLLTLGMLLGGSFAIDVAILVAAMALVVLSRITLVQAGIGLTCIFALTTSWNAVGYGLVRPSDLAFVLGLICFALASIGQSGRWPRMPAWILQLALAIVVVAALVAVVPYDPDYLLHRVFLDSNGFPAAPETTNLAIILKWVVGLLGVPALIGFAYAWQRKCLPWIGACYASGAAISGFVAASDRLGVTHIGASVLGGVYYGNRQTALTLHPNHLAESCVLAAPFACWMLSALGRRGRIIGALALVGNVLGAYYSGSRGGAVVVVLSVLSAIVLLRSLRRQLVIAAAAAAIVGLAILVRYPNLIATVQSTTRLNSDNSTSISDTARAALAKQARADIGHSPIYGNGLHLALSSHDIYLQTFASGGLVLLIAFLAYVGFTVRRGVEWARTDQLGIAATVSAVSYIVLGVVENFITDRYLFVSVGLIAASAPSFTAPRGAGFGRFTKARVRRAAVNSGV